MTRDRSDYFTWGPGHLVRVEPTITEVGEDWTGTAAELIERHGGAAAWSTELAGRLYAIAVGETTTVGLASGKSLVAKRVA